MKTTFPKAKPKIVQYRDYKNFSEETFRLDLKQAIETEVVMTYSKFEEIFLDVLNKHAPQKKKVFRANHKPYMTKVLRKAIMRRSALENKYYRDKLPESRIAYRKQKNYTNRLMKKEENKYFSNLDLKNYTDNKKFWKTVKPLFSNYGRGSQKITLIEDGNIISDDKELAETFSAFFKNSVEALEILENNVLLNPTGDLTDPVEVALKKFETHPSIIDIKQKVNVETQFSFSKVERRDIELEIRNLETKKASTFMNISAKQLKQVADIIVEPLLEIWIKEIIEGMKFPYKLKHADLSPIFKKLESMKVKKL